MNIGILGIGAVGGYFGGQLADTYAGSSDIRITFITRPATGAIIREAGLKLITPEGEKVVRPHLVAWDGEEVGPLDVLICATKSYDLEESLAPLSACVTANTLILPLLNGVDAGARIGRMYPAAEVLGGCVYLVARRIAPGVVKETGSARRLYFGSATAPAERLNQLQEVFTGAGIDSHLSEHIERDVWEKFVFTAGMANATSFFDQTMGEVLADGAHRDVLHMLVEEAHAIAQAKNIPLPDDTVAATLRKMEKLAFDATSSMHSDFQKGGKTEYRSLTAHVANLGDELHVETPTFDKILTAFEDREKTMRMR